ncbi:MAG: 2-hydroxychromene-2-carboxylate isomerase [Litorimonas sp.]
MSREIDFYYDFGSPNVYLAWRALSRVDGLNLTLKPALIGGLFKSANNQPPWRAFADVPAKMKYMWVEIDRFVAMYDLPDYRFNPDFPVMTILPMRAAMVALDEGTHERFFEPVQVAMWERGLDISKPDVLASVLDAVGLDGAAMVARTQEPAIKDALKTATQAATERGLFGLPTWFARNAEGQDEMFFGKDCCWMFGAEPVRLP